MRFFLLFLLAFVWAATETDTDTTSTVSPTLVWVTGTKSDGVFATFESAYTQKFTSRFTAVATPSSASIGLGSISGTVGRIRTYGSTTINGANSTGTSWLVSLIPLIWAAVGLLGGKVHGSLARAGKVKSQTPKVEKTEKPKVPKGRAHMRLLYTKRFVNVTLVNGKRKANSNAA